MISRTLCLEFIEGAHVKVRRIRLEELPPFCLHEFLNALFASGMIPEEVMVNLREHSRSQIEKEVIIKHRFQDFQPALPHTLVSPNNEASLHVEMPVFLGYVLADHFNLVEVPHAKPHFVGYSDEGKVKWVEPHHASNNRIHRHLVVPGEEEILDAWDHRARASAVAANGSIHNCEDGWVNVLLDH